MTHLRQIMLEELRRRNYAESTIHIYIHTVEHFSRHFHRSPDQLGPEHIRQYQAALFTRWKLAPNTVTQRLAALRFFYVQVLKRGWSVAETPYPKKVLHLPQVLSQEEVARLIDAAEFPFHRILLMTLYATGARRAEVAHLKISDIDSQRMVAGLMERIAPINTSFDPERSAIPMLAWAELPPCILDKGCKFCMCHWVLAHRKGIRDCYDFLWIFIGTSTDFVHGAADCEFPGWENHHLWAVRPAVAKCLSDDMTGRRGVLRIPPSRR
ncbi:MAG TPA: site-specific integrase [Candidatus Sulfotelmatobacter sp.]